MWDVYRALHAQVAGLPRAPEGAGQQYRINVLHASLGPAGRDRGPQVDGFAGFGSSNPEEAVTYGWHFFNLKSFAAC